MSYTSEHIEATNSCDGTLSRKFQGSSHGSHSPEGVIPGDFRYIRKSNDSENGANLYVFLTSHGDNIFKSVNVRVLVIPESDLFFPGE